jgi:hypothetical protein
MSEVSGLRCRDRGVETPTVRMNGALVRLIGYLPDPLVIAGGLLVRGFTGGHLAFRRRIPQAAA